MTRRRASRREFLTRAAAGAGAVAGAGIVPGVGAAQEPHAAAAQPRAGGQGHHAFFNQVDAATVAAFAERLMPGAPGKPGARDAGVLNYIDLALAGAYAELQDFYRRGLAQLEAYCRAVHKESFVRLRPPQQDAVIRALEDGTATGFAWPTAQEFFDTVRTHTMEGLFADPVYGGNKDFAGWRLVGFPGAQPVFTSADMQSRQAFTRAPIIGLQAIRK
jgi:gluconate 2-dehydrogenase gamma chain